MQGGWSFSRRSILQIRSTGLSKPQTLGFQNDGAINNDAGYLLEEVY